MYRRVEDDEAQGTYYTKVPGPLGLGWVVRNRRASQARAWLAPLQNLSDVMRPKDKDRSENIRGKSSPSERERWETSPSERIAGKSSTGTQWTLGMGGWVLKPGFLQESTRAAVVAANSAQKSADLAVIAQSLSAGQHTKW